MEELESSANPALHTQYFDYPISRLSLVIQVLQLSTLSQASQLQSQGTQLSEELFTKWSGHLQYPLCINLKLDIIQVKQFPLDCYNIL